jgi:hypothetical protein
VHRGPALRGPWHKASKLQRRLVTIVSALAIMLLSPVVTATAGSPTQLTNAQLDKVNAGRQAIASGTGEALGAQATTTSITGTAISQSGPSDASAIGQVTSMAASQSGNAGATATARLSLSLSLGGR